MPDITLKRANIIDTLIKYFAAFSAIYILIYSTLSVAGSYQPFSVGTFGVESYVWAPAGFHNQSHHAGDLGWNKAMCYVFFPVWWFDNMYIHKQR